MKEYTMNDVRLAVNMAFDMFGDKIRKGDKTPYIGHLLRVLGIVQEGSGGFRAQVGAVLHDVIEDIDGGEDAIRQAFGEDMVSLVRECSDTDVRPKPAWKERKIMHIAHMEHASADALRILLADKIDNGRSLCVLANYADLNSFNATPHDQAWYFHSVSAAMSAWSDILPGYQVDELSDIAEELADLVDYVPVE
jgi:(p)ppGpp synthase/HD superfamily hydrolase